MIKPAYNGGPFLKNMMPSIFLALCQQKNGGKILLLLYIAEKTIMTEPEIPSISTSTATPLVTKALFDEWVKGDLSATDECKRRLLANEGPIVDRMLIHGSIDEKTMLGNPDLVKEKCFEAMDRKVRVKRDFVWEGDEAIHAYFRERLRLRSFDALKKTWYSVVHTRQSKKVTKGLFDQWINSDPQAVKSCREILSGAINDKSLVQGGTPVDDPDLVKNNAFNQVDEQVKARKVAWKGHKGIVSFFIARLEKELGETGGPIARSQESSLVKDISTDDPGGNSDQTVSLCPKTWTTTGKEEITECACRLFQYMEANLTKAKIQAAFAYAVILAIKKSFFFLSDRYSFWSESNKLIEPTDNSITKSLILMLDCNSDKLIPEEKTFPLDEEIELSKNEVLTIEIYQRGWIIWDWGRFEIFPVKRNETEKKWCVYDDAFTMSIKSLLEDLDDSQIAIEVDWEFVRCIMGMIHQKKTVGGRQRNDFDSQYRHFKRKFGVVFPESLKEGQ